MHLIFYSFNQEICKKYKLDINIITTQIINGKAVYQLSIDAVMSQCKLQKLNCINSFCLWFCGLAGLAGHG